MMIDIETDDMEEISLFSSSNPVEEVFHVKAITNMLREWTGSFSDDSFLRSLIERIPQHLNTGWTEELKTMEKTWMEENGTNYIQFGRLLDKPAIERIVIGGLLKAVPAALEDFPITDTCRTLAGLMDLNDTETLILQLGLEVRDIRYPFDLIYARMAGVVVPKEHMLAVMLGRPIGDVKAALNGFLTKSGFLEPSSYPENLYQISSIFEDNLNDRNLDATDIEKLLFPNSRSTELTTADYPHIETDVTRSENIINEALTNKRKGANVLFWGNAGVGKSELAIALAQKNGWAIKSIGDISDANAEEKSRAQRLTSLKMAIKLFANDGKTVLLFDEIEDLFKTDNNATFSKAFINRIIETTSVPIIWTTNSLHALGEPVLRRMTYNIHFPIPPKKVRRMMWEKYATYYGVGLNDDTKLMLDVFDLSPALIHNTMKVTSSALTGKTGDVKQEDVREIVVSLDRLVNLGDKRKFDLSMGKDDPFYDVSCSNTEYDLGSFTEKLASAKSAAFALCLYGPPGTGKSKYGRYLAHRMGKSVLFKRASDLQSMWVGECEKNIAKAFEEAKEENKVLIIDEGDSFLHRREGAKNSWEVSQVNEMLSQMEEHPEPFIITTNLMGNLDPAAMRRFTFKMKFDYMKPEQSIRLFQRYYHVDPPVRIERNHLLTPGDISCVLKQVTVLGITDAETIYQMIEAEVALKDDFSRGIGF